MSQAASRSCDAGQGLTGRAHERLEEGELLRGQLELRLAAPRAAGGRVEPQRADLEHVGRSTRAAALSARSRASSSWKREGLDEIVVGTGSRGPVDAVVERIARREQQDRRPDPVRAQPRQAAKPSMPGSMTSSTIAAYGRARAIHSASSPQAATSAECPSSCRPRRSSPASLGLVLDNSSRITGHCGFRGQRRSPDDRSHRSFIDDRCHCVSMVDLDTANRSRVPRSGGGLVVGAHRRHGREPRLTGRSRPCFSRSCSRSRA